MLSVLRSGRVCMLFSLDFGVLLLLDLSISCQTLTSCFFSENHLQQELTVRHWSMACTSDHQHNLQLVQKDFNFRENKISTNYITACISVWTTMYAYIQTCIHLHFLWASLQLSETFVWVKNFTGSIERFFSHLFLFWESCLFLPFVFLVYCF